MPGVYVTRHGHVGVGFGCLGTLFFGLFYLLYWMLVLTLIALAVGVFIVALAAADAGVGIDALLMHRESYRAKRLGRGPLKWPQAVNVGSAAFVNGLTKKGRRK